MHGDAVHRRRHPVLAHPVTDIAAGEVAAADVLLVLGLGVVRRRQVGRAADQLRNDPGQACRAPCPRPGASRSSRSPAGSRRRAWRSLRRDRAAARRAGAAGTRRGARRRGVAGALPRRGARPRRARRPRATPRGCPRGSTKGGSLQPSRSRAPAISAAPSGEPCAAAVPALVGAPKAIVVRQAIRFGRSLVLGAPDGLGDRLVIMAVDPFGGPAMRPEAQRPGRRRPRARSGRRSKSNCRPRTRSAC